MINININIYPVKHDILDRVRCPPDINYFVRIFPARQRSLRPSRTFNKNSAKINIEPDQTKVKEAPVIAQLSTDI